MTFQKLTKTWESIPSTTQIRKSNIYTCASAYCKMYIQWSLNIKLLPRCLRMAREYHVRSVERDSLQKVENLDENPNQGSLWSQTLHCWWFSCSSIWCFMENLDENTHIRGRCDCDFDGDFHVLLYDSAPCKIGNIDNHWRTFLVIYGDDIFFSLES